MFLVPAEARFKYSVGMTTPRNHDSESESDNVTDLAAFRERLHAVAAGAGTPDSGGARVGETDAAAGAFSAAPLKPIPLKAPPEMPSQVRLRIDIADSHPPIWRRLLLPSNMTLDTLHDVLQTAFGWTDSHLHRFALPGDPFGHEMQGILTPFDVEEGDVGVLESELRLDELLAQADDSLLYTYDFGDEWEHTITCEEVLPLAAADATVQCIDGGRRGPAEDVGGIHSWEQLLAVAAGAAKPEYEEQKAVAFELGLNTIVDEVDLAEINRGLQRLAGAEAALMRLRQQTTVDDAPSPLATLVAGVGEHAQRYLAGYLAVAKVGEHIEVDEAEAAAATAVIRVFLGNVGDGIRLTGAGYLPPARVQALMHELDPDNMWQGEANREAQTYPLLFLRETLTRLGLVRKYRGDLLPTKQGLRLSDAPVQLWHHVAARLPLERSDHGRDCALLLLLLVAAGEADSWDTTRESLDLLSAMVGWEFGGHGRYGNDSALSDAVDTRRVLGWAGMGCLLPVPGAAARGLDTDVARRLACTALTTWA